MHLRAIHDVGRISCAVLALSFPPPRLVLSRNACSFAAAIGAGAAALLAPAAALLLVGLLSAVALMRARAPRLELGPLLGPGFAALLVGAFVGLEGAIGMLFVWRLFADARWSVREAARLAAASGRETTWRSLVHAWTTPLYGLTVVAFTAPHSVAGLPLDLPHVPLAAVLIAGALAAAAVFDWAIRCAADWRLGELARAPAAHLLAHHLVFVLAFGLMLDVSAGIVALIAWRLAHACQTSAGALPWRLSST
jgi:hypothetical protein